MKTFIVMATKGNDLEADIRAAMAKTAYPMVYVKADTKFFEASKVWKVDIDIDSGAGTWAIDGFDVRLRGLSAAETRQTLQLEAMK